MPSTHTIASAEGAHRTTEEGTHYTNAWVISTPCRSTSTSAKKTRIATFHQRHWNQCSILTLKHTCVLKTVIPFRDAAKQLRLSNEGGDDRRPLARPKRGSSQPTPQIVRMYVLPLSVFLRGDGVPPGSLVGAGGEDGGADGTNRPVGHPSGHLGLLRPMVRHGT